MKFKSFIFAALLSLAVSAGAALISGKDQGAEYIFNANSAGQFSPAHLAGERNEDSTTGTDYTVTSPECKMSAMIDLATDAGATIYAGPAMLCGYMMLTTIGTTAIDIKDNATAKITLPVAWPVGSYNTFGARFDTSLVVTPAVGSTGTILFFYKPLDTGVTW